MLIPRAVRTENYIRLSLKDCLKTSIGRLHRWHRQLVARKWTYARHSQRRGVLAEYTVFVIHLASRRVQILGSTARPDEAFMRQVGRTLTMADAAPCRILICDRDTKWTGRVRECLQDAGIPCCPDAVSGAEYECVRRTVVRSIKEECLDRIIPLGEHHFRRAVREFVEHHHLETLRQRLQLLTIQPADQHAEPSAEPTCRTRPRIYITCKMAVLVVDRVVGHFGFSQSQRRPDTPPCFSLGELLGLSVQSLPGMTRGWHVRVPLHGEDQRVSRARAEPHGQ